MNIVLWVLQIVLAVVLLGAGALKVVKPIAELKPQMGPWVDDFGQQGVRALGAAEVAGAIGLVLPALTGILPWLTPLAAVGTVIVMVGAVVIHLRQHEPPQAVLTAAFAVAAAVVAWGRFGPYSL